MADGTRVLLLAYADDIALMTSSWEESQSIMKVICDFLFHHGVTLAADSDRAESKTVYITNEEQTRPLSLRCFGRDSRPGEVKSKSVRLSPYGKEHVFVYLGGRLTLNLDWPTIARETRSSVDRELAKLTRKRLSLTEVEAVASSVVQGKAGYFLH